MTFPVTGQWHTGITFLLSKKARYKIRAFFITYEKFLPYRAANHGLFQWHACHAVAYL